MELKNYSEEGQKLLAEFNALRYRGEFAEYLVKSEQLPIQHEIWETIQILSIDVHLDRGDIPSAYELAKYAFRTIKDYNLKTRAQVEYLDLEWFINGQKENEANQLLAKYSELLSDSNLCKLTYAYTKRAIFKLLGSRFELGMMDYGQKGGLVEYLENVIADFKALGENEEAYDNIDRLVNLYLDSQGFEADKAEECLLRYLEEPFVQEEPHRQATLSLKLMGIYYDQFLNKQKPASYYERFKNNVEQYFDQANNKLGATLIKEILGGRDLKYGLEKGEVLLKEVINEYIRKDEEPLALKSISKLANWYEMRGEFDLSEQYRKMESDFRDKYWENLYSDLSLFKRAFELSKAGFTQESIQIHSEVVLKLDNNLIETSTINRATDLTNSGRAGEAVELLKERLDRHREGFISIHYLQTLNTYCHCLEAQSILLKSDNDNEILQTYQEAVNGFLTINMPENVLDSLKNRMVSLVQLGRAFGWKEIYLNQIQQDLSEAELIAFNNQSVKSHQGLGHVYEAVAHFFSSTGNIKNSSMFVQKAEEVYSKFGIIVPLAFNRVYFALNIINYAIGLRNRTLLEEQYFKLEESRKFFQRTNNVHFERFVWFYMALCKHYQISYCSVNDKVIEQGAEDCYRRAFELVHFLIRANLPQVQNLQHAYDFSRNLQREIDQQLFSAMHFALRDTHNPSFGLWVLEKNKSQVLLSRLLPTKELNIHSEKKGEEPDTMETLLKDTNFLQQGQNGLIIQYWYHLDDIYLIGMHSSWDKPRSKLVSKEARKVMTVVKRFFHTQGGVRRMYQNSRDKVWEECAHIISPIAEWSEPDDLVCIIPYGELNGVPLHTLKLDGQYLIERNPVHYAPSTTILSKILQKKYPNCRSEVAVFGNPTKDLLNAREEAENIAKEFSVDAILEDAIDKQVLLDAFQSSRQVHFAGHGEYKQDGMKGHLKLKDDVNLNASEIFEQEFNNDLVVLSGCETGVQTYNIGDDMVGLTTAFLYAGSQSVVSSLWKVQDYSSSLLFKVFYDEYKQGVSKAVALQRAAKKLIGNPKTKHIYHWGAFTLTGQWK